MFLTKTIYYSRAIIDNVNSGNLLVAFQSRSSSKAVSEINPSTAALIASRSPPGFFGQIAPGYQSPYVILIHAHRNATCPLASPCAVPFRSRCGRAVV